MEMMGLWGVVSDALRAVVGSLPYLLANILQLACLAVAAPPSSSFVLLPHFLLASLSLFLSQPQSSMSDALTFLHCLKMLQPLGCLCHPPGQ